MSHAIELDKLGKVYARTWRRAPFEAVRGVSLSVAEGEAFGFIGPNGAGKSTTIKILTGALFATSGRVLLHGRDVSDPLARQGLGYVPENPCLNDCLTPREVLTMGARMHGQRGPDLARAVMRWLERFGIGHVADKTIRAFSKGMTQRVALAHALCLKPRLLVLDEPLSGLDPIGRHEVIDILSEYKRDGGTLFFSSHVLYDVERLADRYGLIHLGQLRSVKSPAELAGADDLFTVRTQGATAVEGMQAEFAGRWVGEVPRQQLWGQLASLRAAGHEVLEVRPQLSLERAFMSVVKAQQKASAKAEG